MAIKKSKGVNDSEQFLADLCERTFLKLWSYPNPYKDDGHELCDLLAVFEKHVFIFFDRDKNLDHTSEKDPQVLWDRWKRNVIDAQIKTAHGAERYIASGRLIYLDGKRQVLFPLNIDVNNMVVHKIIVAHGARVACEHSSVTNIYGSLAIQYSNSTTDNLTSPLFHIYIDKNNPVHVFDSFNLPILLNELDTVVDFTNYLNAKLDAIRNLGCLSYCGEEDLLAHYFTNFDENSKCHFIRTKDFSYDAVMIGEGEWSDFSKSQTYQNTKTANKVSYLWDEIIQNTCQYKLDGKLLGDDDVFNERSAIHEMAKESRFVRRNLANRMVNAINKFPDTVNALTTFLTFTTSFYPDKGYVFLQLWAIPSICENSEYREKRQTFLEIACGSAKNKFPNLKTVIGIAIDAPKHAEKNAEDFIVMDCESWSDEQKSYYQELNKDCGFFKDTTPINSFRSTEFVSSK